jgi:hypothetical protein
VGEVSGGGATPVAASGTNAASIGEPPQGMLGFNAGIDNSGREPYTQAGGHPFALHTEFNFETYSNATSGSYARTGVAPVHDPKDISAELPPGLIINPNAVPHCSLADYYSEACENNRDAVGNACIRAFARGEGHCHFMEPIYNLEAEKFFPAQLGITVGGAPFIVISARVLNDGGYHAQATDVGIQVDLTRVRLTLWGVPADEGHDALRGKGCAYVFDEWGTEEENYAECEEDAGLFVLGNGGPAEAPPAPFLTLPTDCSGEPVKVTGRYDTWSLPGQYSERTVELPPLDSCNQLTFEPIVEARPTTTLSDAPSGLNFQLQIPQNEDPEGVATPALRDAVVQLPKGLSINPATAQGLQGCTEAQVELHSDEASHCPDASKLGEAEIESPLLHEPLTGALYLATPYKNPFGSLLAGYLSVAGQGVRIKVPQEFEPDPETGQITATFPENPELPFEEMKLTIFGGALGVFRTPAVCGTYQTTAMLTPYSAPESGPPAQRSSAFKTTDSGHGGSCPTAPSQLSHAPLLRVGTETPQAGAYSPFSLKLVREDGSQELSSFDVLLPPGLVAKLAGIPYCPDSAIAAAAAKRGAEENASPSCPAASEVGAVDVGSGAGPTPINVSGHVYLAGPYRGAPLSLAFVTPVLAGPFDLGTTVVRAAVYLDPETVQNHVVSDPLPTVLHGIPLDLRSITVRLNRRAFTLNPTDCEEFRITGSATSISGAAAPLSSRFQVGDCGALRFKPRLTLSLSGGVHRNGHPRLRAVATPTPGGANMARTQVTLPPTELVDNAHLRDICTSVQFAANECPESSIYGHARADTPLLSEPLEGPVYLQPSNHRVPDLVVALRSGVFAINVHLHAREDSVHQRIRTTFEGIPDVPLTKFILNLDGGDRGLLVNSKDLCAKRYRFGVRATGQNGDHYATEPLLRVACGGHRTGKAR